MEGVELWVGGASGGAPQRRCQLFYGLVGVVRGVHKLAPLIVCRGQLTRVN